MTEFLRFWQRLPRLAFGLASFVVLALAILGSDRIRELQQASERIELRELPTLFTGIVSIFVFLTAGAIGIFVLELLVGAIGVAVRWLAARKFTQSLLRFFQLGDLVVPTDKVILEIYSRERQQLLDFYRLRSGATPSHGKSAEELDAFYAQVGKHLDGIRDSSLFVALAYFTSLSQDQVKIEQWEYSIKDLYYFLLFLGSLLILGMRLGISLEAVGILTIFLFTAAILSLPLIRERKRRLASILLAAYCDNFTVGEGAVVEDRSEV